MYIFFQGLYHSLKYAINLIKFKIILIKANLIKFKRTEIIQSTLTKHNEIKIKISKRGLKNPQISVIQHKCK